MCVCEWVTVCVWKTEYDSNSQLLQIEKVLWSYEIILIYLPSQIASSSLSFWNVMLAHVNVLQWKEMFSTLQAPQTKKESMHSGRLTSLGIKWFCISYEKESTYLGKEKSSCGSNWIYFSLQINQEKES